MDRSYEKTTGALSAHSSLYFRAVLSISLPHRARIRARERAPWPIGGADSMADRPSAHKQQVTQQSIRPLARSWWLINYTGYNEVLLVIRLIGHTRDRQELHLLTTSWPRCTSRVGWRVIEEGLFEHNK